MIGITSTDYEQLLKNTSYDDRQDITWVFLNSEDADKQRESDFETNLERDNSVVILWSVMDGDLQDEERCKLLLGWCEGFQRDTKTFFDKFRDLADPGDFPETR